MGSNDFETVGNDYIEYIVWAVGSTANFMQLLVQLSNQNDHQPCDKSIALEVVDRIEHMNK